MSLKCYKQDWIKPHWKVEYETPKEARIFVKKLTRHFKLNINVYFNNYTRGKACYRGFIVLPKKNIKLGMICHELGHLLAYRYGYRGHSRRAYKYINRVYSWALRYVPIEILYGIDKNKKTLLLTND